MKKYKLVKCYPGSPDLNTEVHQGISTLYYYGNGDGFSSNITIVEQNPEFWEKVKELPEYVKCTKSHKSISGFEFIKNIVYIVSSEGFVGSSSSKFKHIYVNSPTGEEIFELATKEDYDKQELLAEATRRYPVGTDYITKHINSLKTVRGDFTYYKSIDGVTDHNGGYVYHNGKWAEIVPSFEYTTEDGVKITDEKQTVFGMGVKSFDLYAWKAKSIAKQYKIKWFSTEKVRDEYIKENKPMYSRSDMKNLAQLIWYFDAITMSEGSGYVVAVNKEIDKFPY